MRRRNINLFNLALQSKQLTSKYHVLWPKVGENVLKYYHY